MSTQPLQFLLLFFAGWINRQQADIIAYLLEENRALRDKLGDKPPYSLPEKVRWGRVDEAAHFTWKREQAAMRLTVLPEAGAASEYATAIGWANKAWRVARQEAPLVLARRRGQEVHFVTVFEPFKGDAPSVQRIERADVSAARMPEAHRYCKTGSNAREPD